ncbi:hypothetical protein [Enterococcus sp. DIV1314a]|uniref:hypothetical protein n=1 Tax=Enterococcus sp. DIV1314a TaxID=2774660 RepID=UPI003F25E7A0
MENSNRNDALKFFESMTVEEQKQAIIYLQKVINKPHDCNRKEAQEGESNEKSPT